MGDLTIPDFEARITSVEKALRQAEIRATVGQLALEMIHQIRNPLEALSHFTFLTQQVAEDPEKVRAYLTLAEEQMAHLRYISGKTLRYSQPAFSVEAAGLVKVAEAALRIHQTRFARGHVRLDIDCQRQES